MKKLKRFCAAMLVAALLLTGMALAAVKHVYMEYGDYGTPVGWFQEILGVNETYYDNYSGKYVPYFYTETRKAIRSVQRTYGLTANGKLDANTLYALLGLPYLTEAEDPLVWVPMHGGARYHVNPTCSGLYDPRQMPATCAEVCGFLPCKKCCKW